QHRQSAGNYDSRICRARPRFARRDNSDCLRTVAAGRSQAALSGHLQGAAVAGLGTQGQFGGRFAAHAGIVQEAVCRSPRALKSLCGNWKSSTSAAKQFADKLKTPSFRGTLRAEESLFIWI